MLKEFAGAAMQSRLSGTIGDADLSFSVDDPTSYPTGATAPFVVCLDLGLSTEEKVLCASRAGNVFTVTTRGYDGTIAQAHSATGTVDHVLDAATVSEANAFVNGVGFLRTTEAINARRGTATSDGAGAVLIAHGVVGLNPGLVNLCQVHYRGASGEARPMTVAYVDGTNISATGATASVPVRWSLVYSNAGVWA